MSRTVGNAHLLVLSKAKEGDLELPSGEFLRHNTRGLFAYFNFIICTWFELANSIVPPLRGDKAFIYFMFVLTTRKRNILTVKETIEIVNVYDRKHLSIRKL